MPFQRPDKNGVLELAEELGIHLNAAPWYARRQ